MTTSEVKEILTGTFSDEADRQYWLDKLSEMERNEANIRENEKYYKEMARYAR